MAGINGDAGWDNWDWLPSNPSLSSPPAACHLADALGQLQPFVA